MTMPDDETIAAEKSGAPAGSRTRRQALGVMGASAAFAGMAAMPVQAQAQAQVAVSTPAARTSEGILRTPIPPPVVVPRTELVNVLEYEPQARLVIGAAKLAPVTGSDRTVTDRITLRPRMNIPTDNLDLTSTILGDAHFTPIIV